jgi:RNA polymerase sigma-70 factor (ECF subfamily)
MDLRAGMGRRPEIEEPREFNVIELDDLLPTRRTLLSRLRDAGDDASWQEFFDTYWKLIYHTATRAGLNDAEAQDVVQETVVLVCRNIPEFRYDPARGSFKGWLLQQTRWRISRQLSKRLPLQAAPPSADTSTGTDQVNTVPDPSAPALDTAWDEEWERALIETALRRLQHRTDARDLQMFDLYAIKHWPVSRIAAAFHVSRPRVYLATHRVGRKVKAEIARIKDKLM